MTPSDPNSATSLQELISQLTRENEQLYQQFNHLMIRNGKLLKRIDDQQLIINELHQRLDELNRHNNNLLLLNDHVRSGYDNRNDAQMFLAAQAKQHVQDGELSGIAFDELYEKWKNYPGQEAKNEPTLRKQTLMLAYLNNNKSLRAADLFYKAGIGGVTGARYVSMLKKHGLIKYNGARKKGHYEITEKGRNFISSPLTLYARPSIESHFTEGTLLKDLPKEVQEKISSSPTSFDHFDL